MQIEELLTHQPNEIKLQKFFYKKIQLRDFLNYNEEDSSVMTVYKDNSLLQQLISIIYVPAKNERQNNVLTAFIALLRLL